MYLAINDDKIPGTVIYKKDMDGSTGLEFLEKIFFLKEGIPLSLVRDISGLDSSTLQNWVKRGWISNTVNKLYSINTFARIIIINMLRDTMQLARISYILAYINGNVDDRSDDIIPESKLYDYICKITDKLLGEATLCDDAMLHNLINELIDDDDLNHNIPDAKARLVSALEVIIIARYAAIVRYHADELFTENIMDKALVPPMPKKDDINPR